MEEILESIMNGQRIQALQQLEHSRHTLKELFITLLELGKPYEIIVMYQVALNQGYLCFSKMKEE